VPLGQCTTLPSMPAPQRCEAFFSVTLPSQPSREQ
jgi:hypothetical protein